MLPWESWGFSWCLGTAGHCEQGPIRAPVSGVGSSQKEKRTEGSGCKPPPQAPPAWALGNEKCFEIWSSWRAAPKPLRGGGMDPADTPGGVGPPGVPNAVGSWLSWGEAPAGQNPNIPPQPGGWRRRNRAAPGGAMLGEGSAWSCSAMRPSSIAPSHGQGMHAGCVGSKSSSSHAGSSDCNTPHDISGTS